MNNKLITVKYRCCRKYHCTCQITLFHLISTQYICPPLVAATTVSSNTTGGGFYIGFQVYGVQHFTGHIGKSGKNN
jgi:hypothetical protein